MTFVVLAVLLAAAAAFWIAAWRMHPASTQARRFSRAVSGSMHAPGWEVRRWTDTTHGSSSLQRWPPTAP